MSNLCWHLYSAKSSLKFVYPRKQLEYLCIIPHVLHFLSLFHKLHLTLICIKCVPVDLSTIFLASIFTQEKQEYSDSMYSSILMLENIWYYHFTWRELNSQEIVNLFQFNSGHWGPTIRTKFTISCEFGPFQVKSWCHIFSNMKHKKFMESELLGILRVKVVSKNILLGSLVTQRLAVFAMPCLFLEKQTNFLNHT